MKLLEVSGLTQMEKMPDIAELFGMIEDEKGTNNVNGQRE